MRVEVLQWKMSRVGRENGLWVSFQASVRALSCSLRAEESNFFFFLKQMITWGQGSCLKGWGGDLSPERWNLNLLPRGQEMRDCWVMTVGTER